MNAQSLAFLQTHKPQTALLIVCRLSGIRRMNLKCLYPTLKKKALLGNYMLNLKSKVKRRVVKTLGAVDYDNPERVATYLCRLLNMLDQVDVENQLITLYGVVHNQLDLIEPLCDAIPTPRTEVGLFLEYLIRLTDDNPQEHPSLLYRQILSLKEHFDMPCGTPMYVFILMSATLNESPDLPDTLYDSENMELTLAEIIHHPCNFSMLYSFYYLLNETLPVCYEYMMTNGVSYAGATCAVLAFADNWQEPIDYFKREPRKALRDAEQRLLSRYPELYAKRFGSESVPHKTYKTLIFLSLCHTPENVV